MKISYEVILSLNPCFDRFGNFIAKYPNFNGTLVEFISLDKITYSDKIWVVTKLFTQDQNIAWARKCSESVQHLIKSSISNSSISPANRAASYNSSRMFTIDVAAATIITAAYDAALAVTAPAYAAEKRARSKANKAYKAMTKTTTAASKTAYADACAAITVAAKLANSTHNVAFFIAKHAQETKNLNFLLECL